VVLKMNNELLCWQILYNLRMIHHAELVIEIIDKISIENDYEYNHPEGIQEYITGVLNLLEGRKKSLSLTIHIHQSGIFNAKAKLVKNTKSIVLTIDGVTKFGTKTQRRYKYELDV